MSVDVTMSHGPLSPEGGTDVLREEDSLVPVNRMGAGWYFPPLRELDPFLPRTAEEDQLIAELAAGKTLFEILDISLDSDAAIINDEDAGPDIPQAIV